MIQDKEKIIPFLAMIVLLIGIGSTLYVHASQSNLKDSTDKIMINDMVFQVEDLFLAINQITVETDEGEKTGIPLDQVIEYIQLNCPSCNRYTLKASDGYQQTVTWENMKNGILTSELWSFFPDLAHAFWVRDIIEIEVNKI